MALWATATETAPASSRTTVTPSVRGAGSPRYSRGLVGAGPFEDDEARTDWASALEHAARSATDVKRTAATRPPWDRRCAYVLLRTGFLPLASRESCR